MMCLILTEGATNLAVYFRNVRIENIVKATSRRRTANCKTWAKYQHRATYCDNHSSKLENLFEKILHNSFTEIRAQNVLLVVIY